VKNIPYLDSGLPLVILEKAESIYSPIVVAQSGKKRSLWFCSKNKRKSLQGVIDVTRPEKPVLDVIRAMSQVGRQKNPQNALVLGLGTGSIVNYLNRFCPNTKVDVVEIDPRVIHLAKKWFLFSKFNNIVNDDATKYIKKTPKRWDCIFADIDAASDLKINSNKFVNDLKSRLNSNGVVIFNIILGPRQSHSGKYKNHKRVLRKIKDIKKTFSKILAYKIPCSSNLILIAS
jgi:spermidine synthase